MSIDFSTSLSLSTHYYVISRENTLLLVLWIKKCKNPIKLTNTEFPSLINYGRDWQLQKISIVAIRKSRDLDSAFWETIF